MNSRARSDFRTSSLLGHSSFLLFGFPFVHEQFVPIRIPKLRHPTDRRFRFVDVERNTTLLEFRVGAVEIFHFKCDRGTVARWFPHWMTTDANRDRPEIVLDPSSFHRGVTRFQFEYLLIKSPRPVLIRNSDSDERYFFSNHEQVPFSFSGFSL